MTAFLCAIPSQIELWDALIRITDCALLLGGPVVIPVALVLLVFLLGVVWHGKSEGDEPPAAVAERLPNRRG